jgi:hypothetical protein
VWLCKLIGNTDANTQKLGFFFFREKLSLRWLYLVQVD